MAILTDTKSLTVPAGATLTVPDGCRGMDANYRGAADAQCFFVGSNKPSNFQPQAPDATYPAPVSIPPGEPYTLEYNENGYYGFQINNAAGTDVCDVVLKY